MNNGFEPNGGVYTEFKYYKVWIVLDLEFIKWFAIKPTETSLVNSWLNHEMVDLAELW